MVIVRALTGQVILPSAFMDPTLFDWPEHEPQDEEAAHLAEQRRLIAKLREQLVPAPDQASPSAGSEERRPDEPAP